MITWAGFACFSLGVVVGAAALLIGCIAVARHIARGEADVNGEPERDAGNI